MTKPNPTLLQYYTARAKANTPKSKTKKQAEDLWQSPVVKGALIAVGVVGGIYLLGKGLRIVGGAINDAKFFTEALKK